MTSPAFEAKQNILGAPGQLVDQTDLAGRQGLFVHPCVENREVDSFDFLLLCH